MIYRSRAPLRLGLAGGGTDVSPYSDLYGGITLNATITIYAEASIEPIDTPYVIIRSYDRGQEIQYDLKNELPIDGSLDLAKGVYNRVVRDYGPLSSGIVLTSFVDVPQGSGLGTSSALCTAILGAFVEYLRLPLGEYEIARLAYDIERIDLQMAGGKQDQYATTFGGVNYMEYFENDKVIVNPLRIKNEYLSELEHNLVLLFTSQTRESAKIIKAQSQNVTDKNNKSLEAMHLLKDQALQMKNALLQGRIDDVGPILDFGFQNKKQMAEGITNPLIEEFYKTAINHGSTGGKISGAGGGGFIIFYCPLNTRFAVIDALTKLGGRHYPYQFEKNGLKTWNNSNK